MEELTIQTLSEVLSPEQVRIVEAHKSEFKHNQCVQNARLIGKLLSINCVEGVILVALDRSQQMRYCRHCWNVTSDGHFFDVSAEYCFRVRPDVIQYFGIAECDEDDYQQLQKEKPSKVFCSDAVVVSLKLNFNAGIEDLKELENRVLEMGKEYEASTGDLLNMPDSFERDKMIVLLKEKYKECRDLFGQFKQRLKETIDYLFEDLPNEEKCLFKPLADDVLSDTTNDQSKSRLQKLEELEVLVETYTRNNL